MVPDPGSPLADADFADLLLRHTALAFGDQHVGHRPPAALVVHRFWRQSGTVRGVMRRKSAQLGKISGLSDSRQTYGRFLACSTGPISWFLRGCRTGIVRTRRPCLACLDEPLTRTWLRRRSSRGSLLLAVAHAIAVVVAAGRMVVGLGPDVGRAVLSTISGAASIGVRGRKSRAVRRRQAPCRRSHECRLPPSGSMIKYPHLPLPERSWSVIT